ncbi:head GIN domain-containing protein [Bacteroides togonis]|uniref:head GIN domain-containing protein n=1 Tax=Bacteroides togonis TaxID=1917883 RepID=UPI00094B76A3|nr:head GIN domain-containing protein [Bacteroides togonis]
MKKFTTLTSIFLLTTVMSACAQSYSHHFNSGNSWLGGKEVKASKNYVTKQIKVSDFDQIAVSGSLDVTYTQQSGKPKVEIYTSDNIVDLLDIYVKNGKLNLGFKKNVKVSYNKLEIRVTSEDLNAVNVAGSGDFKFTNGLKTDQLKMNVAGSGDITASNIQCSQGFTANVAGSGDIECKQLKAADMDISVAGSGDLKIENALVTSVNASVAGSGTVKISGNADKANYSVAGSGDLYANDFKVQNISASVAGSGDIKCHAVEHLKARVSGSGTIGYKGDPELDYPEKKKVYKL